MNENQVRLLPQPKLESSPKQNASVDNPTRATTDDPGKLTRTVGSSRAVDLMSVNCLQLITSKNARILTSSSAS